MSDDTTPPGAHGCSAQHRKSRAYTNLLRSLQDHRLVILRARPRGARGVERRRRGVDGPETGRGAVLRAVVVEVRVELWIVLANGSAILDLDVLPVLLRGADGNQERVVAAEAYEEEVPPVAGAGEALEVRRRRWAVPPAFPTHEASRADQAGNPQLSCQAGERLRVPRLFVRLRGREPLLGPFPVAVLRRLDLRQGAGREPANATGIEEGQAVVEVLRIAPRRLDELVLELLADGLVEPRGGRVHAVQHVRGERVPRAGHELDDVVQGGKVLRP